MTSSSLAGRSGIPLLYREVKKQLIADIQSGAVAPGGALSNESDLAKRFDVSIGTVRRAVDELVADNILVRQQGRGTFVGRLDRARFMFQFFKIAARDGTREFPQVRLHSFARSRATPAEARALALQGAAPVFRIENILALQGRPVIHDHIVIAAALFPGLGKRMFEQRAGTVYELYQSAFGLTIVGADERVRAQAAGESSARLLGLSPGDSVLRIERLALTFDNKPAEFRVSIVDTREFDYVSSAQPTA
ncbi:GntR family transcriptional regulator [Verminephrobacter aporrectodeae subsp. tuberculatae]|uniref:GntR family transcriptional regulator n=1 Tax=Verminephrobacter aporrectodeae subsp. tuberculatae TaxID=1110392 RepID=A0ABT3KWE9_9BURK|nr:GntR family transcriptional regulator [Verminephrobacter aporrectodeae]MCW5256602.1 GntR family transcriptional regulator [Verminephrobacter aporrectodeae subsp. tuberculatae]MCW5322234.1 GntR family transcriptional regulator [Verminephrobacter aporrectodeae subsp. tuberculatae]